MEKLAYIATLDTILWRFALVFGLFIEFLQVCHVKYGRIKTFMQDFLMVSHNTIYHTLII